MIDTEYMHFSNSTYTETATFGGLQPPSQVQFRHRNLDPPPNPVYHPGMMVKLLRVILWTVWKLCSYVKIRLPCARPSMVLVHFYMKELSNPHLHVLP